MSKGPILVTGQVLGRGGHRNFSHCN